MGSVTEKALPELNEQINHHVDRILDCTVESDRYGRLLLASPPDSRYPYVYPRDTNCVLQVFRRIAGSRHGYDAAPRVFELMKSMAHFMKDVLSDSGCWGQRYSLQGEDKSIYKQEDNLAHGIAIVCNYLLTARRLGKEVDDLEGFLECVNRGSSCSLEHYYQKELNLFYSTTAIHESALEEGYTCWVNSAFLYAFSLAHEVAQNLDEGQIISRSLLDFRKHFLYTVGELFISGDRYVRRIDPTGHKDLRPDITLLSPFYFGFLYYQKELEKSVRYLEKHLWDPELGMVMRYLPFHRDFATHLHAGHGPWLQYTAMLAQFHFWIGDHKRGDELLAQITGYAGQKGALPEHLSTCDRFERFLEKEWQTGVDFAKEFHKPILLEQVLFDTILEEANNMSRSYQETARKCMFRGNTPGGGYIQFTTPLAWSHAEYLRALMIRAGDWWKLRD